jgi:hypothetical protein
VPIARASGSLWFIRLLKLTRLRTSMTKRLPRRSHPGWFTIGVCGHRFLADIEIVVAGIDRVLTRIEAVFPGRTLVALSALAEGADRLAAKRVMSRSRGRLNVVLPLPEDDYLTDFATGESKNDFKTLLQQAEKVIRLPTKPARPKAYEAAGNYIVEHSDVLIAVWDGQTEQGRGGTGSTVALARGHRMPIAWVHAGNRRPGTTKPTSIGKEQGKVTYENFSRRPKREKS